MKGILYLFGIVNFSNYKHFSSLQENQKSSHLEYDANQDRLWNYLQRETKRQRVEREFKMQKAGKIVPEDQNLTHTKKTKISPSNLPFKSSQEKELAQVHRKETEAVHSDSDRDDFLDEGDNSNER